MEDEGDGRDSQPQPSGWRAVLTHLRAIAVRKLGTHCALCPSNFPVSAALPSTPLDYIPPEQSRNMVAEIKWIVEGPGSEPTSTIAPAIAGVRPRRAHTKSRTGCKTCKLRRKKVRSHGSIIDGCLSDHPFSATNCSRLVGSVNAKVCTATTWTLFETLRNRRYPGASLSSPCRDRMRARNLREFSNWSKDGTLRPDLTPTMLTFYESLTTL